MKWLEMKIPPAVIFLIFASGMRGLAQTFPWAGISCPGHRLLAAALCTAGMFLGLAGIRTFRQARTTFHPGRPEHVQVLVRGSVYRISRNPMYLGLLVGMASWGVVLANGLSLLLLPGFIAYMNRFQIFPEEYILQDKFGAEFEAYCRTVRRWL